MALAIDSRPAASSSSRAERSSEAFFAEQDAKLKRCAEELAAIRAEEDALVKASLTQMNELMSEHTEDYRVSLDQGEQARTAQDAAFAESFAAQRMENDERLTARRLAIAQRREARRQELVEIRAKHSSELEALSLSHGAQSAERSRPKREHVEGVQPDGVTPSDKAPEQQSEQIDVEHTVCKKETRKRRWWEWST